MPPHPTIRDLYLYAFINPTCARTLSAPFCPTIHMPNPKRMHWLFLGDLEEHSVREVYRGAAEYAARQPHLDLVPWSEYPGRGNGPTSDDLRQADGLLIADVDLPLLGRAATRVNVPYACYLLTPTSHNRRIPAIFMDNHAVGRMAAEHLIQRGYRHLASFGLPDTLWSDLRAVGFREAARERGLNVHSHDSLPTALQVYRPPLMHAQLEALKSALQSLPKPCGIFAVCDVGASYIIRAARELGLHIPDQIGVIGVDDDPIAGSAAGLAISTVEIPCREAGWRAAALLADRIQGKKPTDSPVLPPVRVIARTSTNAFMVADPLVRRALELIEDRRAEGLTVAEIVRILQTTPVTLGQRFREHLKLTPAKYILHRRLEHAKDLLRAGELSVAEVSDACGFHDCSYFCHVFKRTTGTSPSAFRPAPPPR